LGISLVGGKGTTGFGPNLYRLAWQKNQTVREYLCNDNWTRGLWRMFDAKQMAEPVTFWALIIGVQLTNEEDTIL
jgi:hypothetical protein